MTIEEMHRRIGLRVQNINANVFDDLLPGEIDEYINHGIMGFIKDRFQPQSNMFGKGFEQSQKRVDDLRTLVVKNHEIDTEQVTPNEATEGYFVDRAPFPDNYLFAISGRCEIHYNMGGIDFSLTSGQRTPDGSQGTDYGSKTVFIKPVQSDDVYQLLEDPFNRTTVNRPIFDYHNGGIDVYTDDTFIAEHVLLNYLKEPATVLLDEATPSNNVDCDLPEGVHPEIVDMSVELILSDIGGFGPEGQFRSLQDTE